jgi:hypothetical protein
MLHYLENPKIKLHEIIKDIEEELQDTVDNEVILNSFPIQIAKQLENNGVRKKKN